MIPLLLVLFFGATVQVTHDRDVLHPQEILQVTVSGQWSEGEKPNLFRLIEDIQAQKNAGSFSLQSYKIAEDSPSHFELQLTLQPEKLGSLIFAPGLLFLGNEKSVSIPSFTINCQRLYPPLTFVGALPVNPEAAITPDAKSRALIQQESETASLFAVEEAEKRAEAWTLFFCALFGAMLLYAISFLLEWYRARRRMAPPKVVRNWSVELKQVKDFGELQLFLKEYLGWQTGVPLKGKTAEELGALFHENRELQALIQRLQVAEFSGKLATAQDLQAAILQTQSQLRS